ncbi:MAG: tRNA (N(6)-L-threonylcarbamoyladenosine(37)-C(2))-methylthiotransferase, partial [Desulfurococcales archaeon]|nr:tRNA (N(6)-L-threonylcarbamoyladenosine(37)-C(2))-methylthiotransferase [Desulfurococcales archaeon]
MVRYYIETYGCALSTYESLLMDHVLRQRGHERVDTPDRADAIIVSTCAVRLDTEQRIAERLEELSRQYPNRTLVVAGCLARARPGLVRRVAPRASLLAPQAVHLVYRPVETGERLIAIRASRDTRYYPPAPVSGRIATIMIQEGCRNRCSYCITKLSRGEPRSFPPRAIIEQVQNAVRRGAVEIRLTGTDTAAYGVDLPGKPSLADLVELILDKVEGDYMIRIGMMTPEEAMRILDDLLDVYSEPRVYKFFHIPVQSGSDKMLKLMGRRYTVQEYMELHKAVKTRYPESLFATDIIVGHPGEGEDDFHATLNLVETLRFERVHIAQYSLRPHTRAAAMKQVSDGVKKARSKRLTMLVEKIGREIYGSYVGRTVRALVVGEAYR